jgi:hypothetical protein
MNTPRIVTRLEEEMKIHALEVPMVTAEDLGRITAEAITVAHEAASAALAELGKELAERMKSIDKLRADADTALKDCLDTAQAYRDAGKAAADQIKLTAALTNEVRETCEAMRKKIGI